MSQSTRRNAQAPASEFDGNAAFDVLKQICDLGPRVSGSQAMRRQQEQLTEHFQRLGALVERQSFSKPHPVDGREVEMTNLIVRWNPLAERRVMVCAHYDTRPFPDRDPQNPQGLFLGANDGASGVALLHELGKHIPGILGPVGIDLVFFDAEEFVFDSRRDPLFVGSTHFAEQYVRQPPGFRYDAAVLVDMIGDAQLDLYFEKNSLKYASELTHQIWEIADQLGIREFIPRERHEIRDDHLPLNQIAKIPTCDIIDFDYPRPSNQNAYWHTQKDTPDKCSAESLQKVGCVLLQWLKQQE